ncbi:MAG: hypothetical protein EZS28_007162 [Streblomastix strix]|uniref:Uncharacterized protein n=1 Tax=Streblomastix strix TaxID=222440 RepID=A0A5J4WQW9_9EUKA|nr:MAG: hypothetical protein EZS28_007162 [Streblomastix strix]
MNSGLIEQAEEISTLKQHYLVFGSNAQFAGLNLGETVISHIDPAIFSTAPSPISFSIQTPQCTKIDLDREIRLLSGELGDQNIVCISSPIKMLLLTIQEQELPPLTIQEL